MKAFIACEERELAIRLSTALKTLAPTWQLASFPTTWDEQPPDGLAQSPCAVFMSVPDDLELGVRTIHALRRAGAAIVIAVGKNYVPSEILGMLRGGADDYIAVGPDLEAELQTLLQRIQREQVENGQQGILISVVGCGGGTGASLVSTNLAAAIAQEMHSCALLDLILRGGDHALLLKLDPRHTIIDLVSKLHQLDRAMFDQSLVQHECGIHLLAAPEPFCDLRDISPQAVQQVVEFARESFPAVVVELENMYHREQVRTLAESDFVILTMRLDFTSLVRTHRYLEHLDRNDISRDHIRIVANRQGVSKELSAARVQATLGIPVSFCIPDDPGHVYRSINLGNPLILDAPTSKAARVISQLAAELMNKDISNDSKREQVARPLLQAASVLAGLLPVVK